MTTAEHGNAEANAVAIIEQHGAHGAVVIAERIGALAAAHDEEGAAQWMAVAARYVRLQDGGEQAQRDAARRIRALIAAVR